MKLVKLKIKDAYILKLYQKNYFEPKILKRELTNLYPKLSARKTAIINKLNNKFF